MAQIVNEVLEQSVSQQTTVEANDTALDPIEALKEIKQNTVSKEEYNKVVQERNKLFNAFANGQVVNKEEEPAPAPANIHELDMSIYGEEVDPYKIGDLGYFQGLLNLRNALIEQNNEDIFVPAPQGKWSPKPEDFVDAQRRADIYQECINAADGDPQAFTNELKKHIVDLKPKNNYRR